MSMDVSDRFMGEKTTFLGCVDKVKVSSNSVERHELDTRGD